MCQTTVVPFSSPCHLPHSKQSATLSSQPFSGRSRSASSVTLTPALRARPGLPVFARSPGTAENLKPGSHQETPRLAVNRMEFRMTWHLVNFHITMLVPLSIYLGIGPATPQSSMIHAKQWPVNLVQPFLGLWPTQSSWFQVAKGFPWRPNSGWSSRLHLSLKLLDRFTLTARHVFQSLELGTQLRLPCRFQGWAPRSQGFEPAHICISLCN